MQNGTFDMAAAVGVSPRVISWHAPAGTHDTFYEDPGILFISTHQSGSYPQTGKLSEVGAGDGEGASINLPLPGAPLCHPPVTLLSF